MADGRALLDNLESAYRELTEYVALPVRHRRDKAGVIQAFEFTFELFWKAFQKLAPDAGLSPTTPREALQAGVKLHFIEPADASLWTEMLSDRNLTSHTYRAKIADEVFERITQNYVRCFGVALERIKALPSR